MNLAQMAQTLGTAVADHTATLSLEVDASGYGSLVATWGKGRGEGYSVGMPHATPEAVERAFREILQWVQDA